MIKLLPLFMTRNERQHWLISILREMRHENVHLESLRMNSCTHRGLIDYNQMHYIGFNPLQYPCFVGLPIVITCTYNDREIFFSDTFKVPRMPYGSMSDTVYTCEPLPKAHRPTTEAFPGPSDDSKGLGGAVHPPGSFVV